MKLFNVLFLAIFIALLAFFSPKLQQAKAEGEVIVGQPCNFIDGALNQTNGEYNININRGHHDGSDKAIDIGGELGQPYGGNTYQRCNGSDAIASVSGVVTIREMKDSDGGSCGAISGNSYCDYGYFITQKDDISGKEIIYAHLASGSATIASNTHVNAGTKIATIGSTGNSTFNHIHFEVRGSWGSPSTALNFTQWKFAPIGTPKTQVPADYDGDGKPDVAIFQENPNQAGQMIWSIIKSANNEKMEIPHGGPNDIPVPGNIDNDGKADLGIYRVEGGLGYWIYLLSSEGYVYDDRYQKQHGNAGDVPLAGYFDEDDRVDFAIHQGQNWIVLLSTANYDYDIERIEVPHGGGANNPGDKYFTGDFDGDKKYDLGVFRNNKQWIVLLSKENFEYAPGKIIDEEHGGGNQDIRYTGDFNHDERNDLGIYRGGEWITFLSNTSNYDYSYDNRLNFPTHGSFDDKVLAVADYNDDGYTDMTLYRDNEATWHHIFNEPSHTYRSTNLTNGWGVMGAPNSTPTFNTIPNLTIDEGGQFSTFDLDNYGHDNDLHDKLTYTLSGNTNLVIDKNDANVVSVTVPENWYGQETVTFKVEDVAKKSSTKNVIFKVNPVGDDPVITSAPITNAQSYMTYGYQVTATDVDNDPLTFSLIQSPAGMTLMSPLPNKVTIVWTPTNAQVGSNTVKVRVSDGSLHYDQTFNIQVAYSQSNYNGWDVTRSGYGTSSAIPVNADYDGDGKVDVAVFVNSVQYPGQKDWKIYRSSDGVVETRTHGGAGDIPVPGYYDGPDADGKNRADLGIYRGGVWIVLRSNSNYSFEGRLEKTHGNATDKVVQGHYDDDKKTDLGIYRNGTWIVLKSKNNYDYAGRLEKTHGNSTDKLVPGDYDGDGQTDLGIYRNGTWIVLKSGNNHDYAGRLEQPHGNSTDTPAPADYDGDGKFDLGIYRGNTWIVLTSGKSYDYNHRIEKQEGSNGDTPTPADYSGDGRADISLKANASNNWYVDYAQN